MNKDHEHSKNGTHLSDSNQQYASLSDSSDDFLDALQFEAQQVPGLEYEHNDRPKGDIDSDLYDILARDDSTDSSSDDNNSLIDLLCNLTIKTNKMALTVLDEDGPLDDLPKFPFNDLPPDTDTATVTHRRNELQILRIQYSEYNTILIQIRTLELTHKAPRDPDIATVVKGLRKQLSDLASKVHARINSINSILSLQQALKPTLTIPKDHPEGHVGNKVVNPSLPLNVQEVKHYMKSLNTNEDSIDIKEIWDKLLHYSNLRKLSHDNFKMALASCVNGEIFRFIADHSNEPLSQMAQELASRSLNETTFNSAVTSLKTFTRAQNESIRQTTARLSNLIEKAAITFPETQRDAIVDFTMTMRIRELLNTRVRQELDKKMDDSLRAGKRLTVSEMIDFIESQERVFGQPQTELTTSISLNNVSQQPQPVNPPITTSVPPIPPVPTQTDTQIEKLTSLVNSLANVVLTNNSSHTQQHAHDHEINAAMKSVKFTNRSNDRRPARTPTPYERRSVSPSQGTVPRSDTNNFQGTNTRTHDYTTQNTYTKHTSESRPSRQDYSSHKTRYPSYDKHYSKNSNSERDRSNDRLRQVSRNSSDRVTKSRSTSPASFYKNKARYAESMLHKLTKPNQHQPSAHTSMDTSFTNMPIHQNNSHSYQQGYQTNQYRPNQNYPQQMNEHQRDQLYTDKLNNYRARRYQQRYQYRSQSKDNNQRSQSRDRKHPQYKQYRIPNTYRNPVINAYPNSNVSLHTACPFCHSPIDHPIELCHVAQQDIAQIDQEENI